MNKNTQKATGDGWDLLIQIGREVLAESLSEELRAAAPKTNKVVLTQDECAPFSHKDPLIPNPPYTSGTPTPHGIREQEELFCLHCSSIFPAAQLKTDHAGNRCGCGSAGHPDCDGAGFGVDLHNPSSEFSLATMHGWEVSIENARNMGYLGLSDERSTDE